MKRTLSLLLTLILVVLLCVMFCHEAFHNDEDGLCMICSWIFAVRTLLYAAVLALTAGIGLLAYREDTFPRISARASRLPDTPVLLHDKLSD